MRRDDVRHRRCIAGRLHDDMVGRKQCPGEVVKMLPRQTDSTEALDHPFVERRHFRKIAMNIHPDDAHFRSTS